MQSKSIRIITVSLLSFIAINALIAGILFMIDPSGGKLGLSTAYLVHSPFHNYLIPGIVLFIINGLFNVFAIVAMIRNYAFASLIVIIQGILLAGWIIVQVILLQQILLLHGIMLFMGCILILCGMNYKENRSKWF